MKIAIGSDHAAFDAKADLVSHLRGAGHEVSDLGTMTAERCDYPDFAWKVARAVADGAAERGILVCGTGLGMAMTANKLEGIRAAPCESAEAVEMTRGHNDANVLCLGARLLTTEQLRSFADLFLTTPFDGGRHAPRVAKIGLAGEGRDPATWTPEDATAPAR